MKHSGKQRSWLHNPILWVVMGLALVAIFATYMRPVFSSELAAVPEAAEIAAVQPEVAVVTEAEQASAAAITAPETMETSSEETAPLFADTPSSENCITCHTDSTILKAIAEEPEEVHSEEAAGEG